MTIRLKRKHFIFVSTTRKSLQISKLKARQCEFHGVTLQNSECCNPAKMT